MSEERAVEQKPGRRLRALGLPVWSIVILLLLVALLVVLGLGLVRSQQGPVGVGTDVPDFTLTTFDGHQLSTTDYRGQVLVVNFWASWCQPCEQEAAELERAWRDYRDQGVVFLGVNYVDTEPEALGYMRRFDITYPSGPDLGTNIAQQFRILGVPETYVIDGRGKIASVKKGPYSSLGEIEAAIEQALQQSP